MSRFGNLKHGPDNTVTPEDLACWRALIARAKKAAGGDAEAAISAFQVVAKAAGNACAPGVVTRDNLFVKLSKLSRRYVGETAAGRRGLQLELMSAAKAAELVLEPGEDRAPPERKDIYG